MPIGDIFSSKSRQSSTAASAQTGVEGDDNIQNVINLGTIGAGKKSTINLELEQTDFGAVQGALDTVDEAIAANERARLDALEFAAGTLESTAVTVRDTTSDALEFSAGAFQEASGLIEGGITAINESLQQVNKSNLQATQDALTFGAGAIQETLDFTLETQVKTLDIVEGIVDDTLGNVAQSTESTLASLASAQTQTIDAISETTKTETTQSFDKLVTVAAIALVVVGLAGILITRGT